MFQVTAMFSWGSAKGEISMMSGCYQWRPCLAVLIVHLLNKPYNVKRIWSETVSNKIARILVLERRKIKKETYRSVAHKQRKQKNNTRKLV